MSKRITMDRLRGMKFVARLATLIPLTLTFLFAWKLSCHISAICCFFSRSHFVVLYIFFQIPIEIINGGKCSRTDTDVACKSHRSLIHAQ